jgi:hypothetical protein
MARIECAHCGRQIVNYDASDSYCVGHYNNRVKTLGFGKYVCHECDKYDENGMLPEER